MLAWLYLAGAIAAEIFATVMLKYSEGWSKLLPSVCSIIGYVVAFGLLSFALKTFNIGVAYAIWSAVGTAAVAILGIWLFGEKLTLVQVTGLALLIIGVVLLEVGGEH
ncbi:multidrug efflux SMR transporter [Leucobacter sp. OH1287]|uniref:DMT family transporter n=1 Tax=Leucobacter sp. OH1287 TaxID=2491049 RepID=UPI0018F316FF|nr:multidrug efflux SMR transporter [Leucobacter sp. OH1287]